MSAENSYTNDEESDGVEDVGPSEQQRTPHRPGPSGATRAPGGSRDDASSTASDDTEALLASSGSEDERPAQRDARPPQHTPTPSQPRASGGSGSSVPPKPSRSSDGNAGLANTDHAPGRDEHQASRSSYSADSFEQTGSAAVASSQVPAQPEQARAPEPRQQAQQPASRQRIARTSSGQSSRAGPPPGAASAPAGDAPHESQPASRESDLDVARLLLEAGSGSDGETSLVPRIVSNPVQQPGSPPTSARPPAGPLPPPSPSFSRHASRPTSAGPYGRGLPSPSWQPDSEGASPQPVDGPGLVHVHTDAAMHPSSWDIRDVADWVVSIGMQQYRKRFVHSCIDGRLLLALTDHLLRVELGIGPMGHRAAILQAIRELAAEPAPPGHYSVDAYRAGLLQRPGSMVQERVGSAPASGPRRPASAHTPGVIPPDGHLGPAQGKMTVYEQQVKLRYELDRAAARAAQHNALVQQLSHTASVSTEEVARLQALLSDLEKRHRMVVSGSSGGVDVQGRVPWRPPSIRLERSSSSGGAAEAGPRVSKRSQQLLAEMQVQSGARNSFLERLEADARRRERERQAAQRHLYVPAAAPPDPVAARHQLERDLKFLIASLQPKGILSEPVGRTARELDEALDESVLEQCQGVWSIPDEQMEMVQAAHGPRRARLLAAAIRTREFMARYEAEDADRRSGARLRELQMRYWYGAMGRPKQEKAAKDLESCFKHFAQLGWVGEDAVNDDRLAALLRRAVAYNAAVAKARDAGAPVPTIDFFSTSFSGDGLASLQAAAPPPEGKPEPLFATVQLLSRCRPEDLKKMEEASGPAKQLAVYRNIRTQKFIEFTEEEIKAKEKRLTDAWAASAPPKRVVSREDREKFVARLLEDAAARKAAADKRAAERLERELAMLKAPPRPRSRRK